MLFKFACRALIAPMLLTQFVSVGQAQDSASETLDRLKRNVAVLASTKLAGRGNGQDGLNRAVAYVVNTYKKLELEPQLQRFSYSNPLNKGTNVFLNNVIVTIKGNDPELNSQCIVIGAHLDHVGSRKEPDSGIQTIYPGADDNASGTAALMELIRYFSNNPPARTLVFIHFTGEEWGTLGSRYWVANPTVNIESVRFMLNLDMIGRLDSKKSNLTFTAMGMGPDAISKAKAMAPQGLNIETDRGTSIFSMASDHAPFAAKNIPTCFLFTGVHNDYHRPTDTVAKINWNGLATITQFAQTLITEYSTNKDIPDFQPRANLGIISEPSGRARVWRVIQDGSAELAGMKPGDILTFINDHEINSSKELDSVLDLFNRGDTVKLKWMRWEQQMEAEIMLQ